MKIRMRTAWKLAVAMAMLWLHGEAWGVDMSALPLWRSVAGIVMLMVFVKYIEQAAEDDDDEQEA